MAKRRKEVQEAEYRNRKEGMETGFHGRGKRRGRKEPDGTERTAARGDREEAKAEGKGEPEEAAAENEAGGRRKEIADETIR